MSDENASDRLDQRLDAFEQDTGIWPPGRDQAPEMAVGESKEDMRWRAWEYWQKATRQLTAKDADNARLREAIEAMAERLPRLVQDAWRHGFSSTDSGDMATCDAVAAAHVEADGAAALAAKAGQETPCTSPQNPPAPK